MVKLLIAFAILLPTNFTPPTYVIPGRLLPDVIVCYPTWRYGPMRRIRMPFMSQFTFWSRDGSTIYFPWYVAPRKCPKRPGAPVLHVGKIPPYRR
jgi:hypothetical protein